MNTYWRLFTARSRGTGTGPWLIVLWCLACVYLPAHAQEVPKAQAEVLARVGNQDITVQEYAMALRTQARKRFYHAKPPEDVLAAFRREVADQLIDRVLAVQEARRRGIKLDKKSIDAEMEKFRARRTQGGSEHDNKLFWDALRREMEQEQLLGRLRSQVNAKVQPGTAAVKAFYTQHPEKFTQPEQQKVSVILLRVAPSSAQVVWDAATREAGQILARIKSGADFAELARVHSADASAAQGGDMGYLHKGMLAREVEEILAKLSPGDITEPVTVLEGVALFKLLDRKPARLGSFNEVKARATDLLVKEQQAQAWKNLLDSLRASTPIKLDERYLQMPAAAETEPRRSGALVPRAPPSLAGRFQFTVC